MTKLIITGSTGYIGRALTKQAIELGYQITSLGRSTSEVDPQASLHITTIDGQPIEIPEEVGKDSIIIHLAGRAHILKENSDNPEQAFLHANVDFTRLVADAAIKAGAKRFIFISSIGVNGTTSHSALNESSPPTPLSLYAKSKWLAEKNLEHQLRGKMELTIIRPPLVYSYDAPGNFRKLLTIIRTGLPLPLQNANNLRSLIALENLVDFIIKCTTHPLAGNETFLISDMNPISTFELASLLREGMRTKTIFFPIPKTAVQLLARALGKKSLYEQLYGSLEIAPTKARTLLNWEQKIQTSDALKAAAERFSASK